MGSIIEAFPRALTRRAPRLAQMQAWRAVPVNANARVRPSRLEDYAAIRALQREASPFIPGTSLKQLESQRQAFPEGQMVAVCAGRIVGTVSSLIVAWNDHAEGPSWRSVTGEGSFTTHDAAARTLFCAELLAGSIAIARTLHRAQRRLARKLNLRRIVAAARLPGYREAPDEPTPEAYVQRVIWGSSTDTALQMPLSEGFQYCGVIRNYLPEDADSGGHAALLVWLNPAYSPTEPPANLEAVRPRKCA
ncbi:MAG TPA: hypothetical protein VH301_05165 [Usitatibacter sp.]|nr:hypothetical protein [Usitatibacter sp.]